MEVTFGLLDAFAFVVFAVLIAAAVVIVVSLGRLPGRLARRWGHPQASAVNVAGWVAVATGGLLWPLALIWAFVTPSKERASADDKRRGRDQISAAHQPAQPDLSGGREDRP
jgi:Protein of unknown function (DUF3302)